GGDGRLISRGNDHLQIRIAAAGRNVGQCKTVNVAVVGDEVQIRVDAGLRRVNKTEVADYIDNPEIFVAGRRLHDLLGCRNFDQRGVAKLGFDGHNILSVVVHGAGRLLAFAGKGGENNGGCGGEGEEFHWTTPVCICVSATGVWGMVRVAAGRSSIVGAAAGRGSDVWCEEKR